MSPTTRRRMVRRRQTPTVDRRMRGRIKRTRPEKRTKPTKPTRARRQRPRATPRRRRTRLRLLRKIPDLSSGRVLLEIERAEVGRELGGEVRPAQGEIDDGLQEAELVAGIVPHAFHFTCIDRPRLEQGPQSVGELNLARAVALGGRECG